MCCVLSCSCLHHLAAIQTRVNIEMNTFTKIKDAFAIRLSYSHFNEKTGGLRGICMEGGTESGHETHTEHYIVD